MPDHLIRLADPHRARILVVDDIPANLLALEAVLAPLGHEVVGAHSGDEALKHLLRDEFAVILMDVQMPGLDGLETARLIRQRERTRHIPIIFVTALSREAAYVTRGYEEGGVDYLLKPIDPEILRAKVRVFVELFLRGKRLEEQALEIAARRSAEEELQRATELEQQLVGIVGHDIRTPLSAILATAQSQLASGTLDDGQRRSFERVARGGDRIAKIVEVLLDFTRARIGGGIPIVRQHTDLGEVCRRVVDELTAANPGRPVELDCASSRIDGMWDLDRLAQVLANLIDNAIKYGPPDEPVRLTVHEGETHVSLVVHNGGPAIPEEALPNLFDPFRRVDQDDGHVKASLGLGLYIAREIVRSHGGTIAVRSVPGDGTDFEIRLPRLTASDETVEATSAPLSAASA